MTRLEILEAAYEEIKDPTRWAQEVFSRYDTLGVQQVCLYGAISLKGSFSDQLEAKGLCDLIVLRLTRHVHRLTRCARFIVMDGAIDYNDGHKHWQVIRLLRLAIATERVGGLKARDQARRSRQLVIALRKAVHAQPAMSFDLVDA